MKFAHCRLWEVLVLGLKRKCFFPFSREAEMSNIFAKIFVFAKIFAINIFKMINSNGYLTILVHAITVVRFVLKHHPDLTTLKCMVDSTVVRFVLKHHPE
jgi:hypothetical protein